MADVPSWFPYILNYFNFLFLIAFLSSSTLNLHVGVSTVIKTPRLLIDAGLKNVLLFEKIGSTKGKSFSNTGKGVA